MYIIIINIKYTCRYIYVCLGVFFRALSFLPRLYNKAAAMSEANLFGYMVEGAAAAMKRHVRLVVVIRVQCKNSTAPETPISTPPRTHKFLFMQREIAHT